MQDSEAETQVRFVRERKRPLLGRIDYTSFYLMNIYTENTAAAGQRLALTLFVWCFLLSACLKNKVAENCHGKGNSSRGANLGHHHKSGKNGKGAWHTHDIHRTGPVFPVVLR